MSFSTTQHKKHQEHLILVCADDAEPPEEVELAQGLLTHGLVIGGALWCYGEFVSLHIDPTDADRQG